MSVIGIGFPSGPIVNPATGNLTESGRAFLVALFTRDGGSVGLPLANAALAASIATETTDRTAADAALNTAILDEVVARTAAVADEAARRTTAIQAQADQTNLVLASANGLALAETLRATAAELALSAAIEWNAGTVNAIDATQLVISSNMLGIKVGPTIAVTAQTSPLTLNGNTSTAFPTFTANTHLALIGKTGVAAMMEEVSVAGTLTGNSGNAGLTYGRINGTLPSPTTLNAGDRINATNIRGYDGTTYAGNTSCWNIFAGSTWTGTSHEWYQTWSTVPSGSTASSERLRLLSTGAFLIGTTAAIGSEKLRISGQALADFMMVTPSAGLTAHAGGTQAAALALTAGINYITTCATAGDSVRLPVSVAGLIEIIVNAGVASSQAYGAGTDTINNIATATGVPIPAGKTGIYFCTVAGKWFGGVLT